MDSANHRRKTSLFFCSAKPSKRCHDIATCISLVRLAPPAEEQSGDWQRREKGPPILTAEKGEHERAPKAGERHPTPLRATLQAPPSKWAIKAFFPAGERSELSRREAWPQWGLGRSPKRPAGRVGGGPVGSYATPDTPCSRTASEGSLLTERGQTVPALRPELDDPNKFGSSNRSATADRSLGREGARAQWAQLP